MITLIITGPKKWQNKIVSSLKLSQNGKSESLAVKTTYVTHYVSYLNLEVEVSSLKICGFVGNLSSN